ncbi:MAG: glycoside hydrolase family 2 protein [Bacteroidales bacterium]|nr:glycoside hydrolase family 2 protein [Bacteroidales bacterium]
MEIKWNKTLVIIIVLLLLNVRESIAQEGVMLLTSGWKFRKANTIEKWLPATVPGNIYSDLLANKLIPDPYVGCNNTKLKWVDECDWEYQTQFTINSDMFLRSETELEFKGLDTYAKVYLNDSLILTADNMFRSWKVNCSNYLKNGGNYLKIIFKSAQKQVEEQAAKLPYRLPSGDWAYIRKPAYNFGWDWAPTLKTCGIWKKIYLRTKPDFYIENFYFKIAELDESKAEVEANFEVNSPKKQQVSIEILENNSRTSIIEQKADVQKGKTQIQTKFKISNPKLWWPNGMGSQYQYSLSCRVMNRDGKLIVIDKSLGLRKIEIVTKPDSIGSSFYLKVNNKPMFSKGANIVPPNSLISAVRDNEWIALAENAQRCNMNMLRVWGGGIYPPDAFYEACSKKGILVWQDFMFACSMYPWDSLFLKNVRLEATEQVQRLRGFPCLALWCGNNEIDEGWHNWGWIKQVDTIPNATRSIWSGYNRLFNELLPSILKNYDPEKFYWPSSPQFGWGRKESMKSGDSHYWGVWWGLEPFSVFKTKIPRFMSEYGFQGFPDARTVLSFSKDGKAFPDSLELLSHQKHPVGYQTIAKYMQYTGFYPKTLEDTIYFSQVVQAIGYRTAIESHRISMPHCMGTLYWQMNDCWPVVSWSGIDFYGRWKAVQYTIRDAYRPILISLNINNEEIAVNTVSDNQTPTDGELKVLVYNTNGDILKRWINPAIIKPNVSEQILKVVNEFNIADSSNTFAYAEFESKDGEQFNTYSFYCKQGNLRLIDPEIKVKVDNENNLIITCNHPAFYVQLSSTLPSFNVDNNYFNMLPGKEYRVKMFGGDIKDLVIKSMWNYSKK